VLFPLDIGGASLCLAQEKLKMKPAAKKSVEALKHDEPRVGSLWQPYGCDVGLIERRRAQSL